MSELLTAWLIKPKLQLSMLEELVGSLEIILVLLVVFSVGYFMRWFR